MEKSINNFQSTKIESKNSLNITLSYDFLSNLIELNWYDILFCIENDFLSYQSAVEHAIKILDENSSQDVIELTLLKLDNNIFPHSIHPYIDTLANSVSLEQKSQTYEKILYAVLSWLFKNSFKYSYNDLQNKIDIIYADFGYPKSMSNLCSYTIHSPKEFIGIKTPIDRLNKEWLKYLKNMEILFKKPFNSL